jgi:hypothetical protein
MDALKPYAKAIVVFAATLIAIALEWALTNQLDTEELWTAVGGLATALGVYGVPNAPRAPTSARRSRRHSSGPAA